MGSEKEETRFPKLKLPLADLLDSDSEHPFQAPASVPFKWEEQPGKPRPYSPVAEPARSLDLPPCMSSDRFTKTPSPTTVLDGPYAAVARPIFSSFRIFTDGHSFRSPDVGRPERRFFGKIKSGGGGSCRFSPSTSVSSCEIEEAFVGVKKNNKTNTNGNGNGNGSFSSTISHAKSSQLWTSICQGIKQVMNWKSSKKSNKEGRE